MTALIRAPLTLPTLDALGLATQAELDAGLAAKQATIPAGTYAGIAATRAALSASSVLARTLVTEVGGTYRYDAASSATVDGWVVLTAAGGVGRFIFDGPVLTLPIRGGGLDDWPNFAAAGVACAAAGITLRLGLGTYNAKSRQTTATKLHVVCTPLTNISCAIASVDNRDTPFCAFGISSTFTTLAAATNVGDRTITLTADIGLAVGDFVNLSPAAPGAPAWRLALYQVVAYNAGTKVATLDRPIRMRMVSQNSTLSWPAGGGVVKMAPARDILVEFNGAHVYGACNRYIEAINAWKCNFVGPVYLGDGTAMTAVERMISLDDPSYDCHASKLYCDGGGVTIDGLSYECSESSTFEDCTVVRCQNGEILQDAINCSTINCDVNSNTGPGSVFSAAQGAFGAPDNIGCDGCKIVGGSRNGNGSHGVLVEKGSSHCIVDGPAIVGNGGNGVALVGTSSTVTNKALTANVATLTTGTAHGLVVTSSVVVSGVGAPFDGIWTVLAAPTPTTFTFAVTAANIASSAATGKAVNWNLSDNIVTARTQVAKNVSTGIDVGPTATRTRVGGTTIENLNGVRIAAGAVGTELSDLWSLRNTSADAVFFADATCNDVTLVAKAGLVNNMLSVTAGVRVRWRGGRIEAATNGATTILNNGILDIDQTDIVQVAGGIGLQTNNAAAVSRIGSQCRITGQGGGGFGVYAVGGTTAIAAGADVGVVTTAGGRVNFGSATVGATNVVVAYPELKVSDVVVVTRTSGTGAFTVSQTAGTGFTITGTTGDVFAWKVV